MIAYRSRWVWIYLKDDLDEIFPDVPGDSCLPVIC